VARIAYRRESLDALRQRLFSGERAGSAARVAMQVPARRELSGRRCERIHGTRSRPG